MNRRQVILGSAAGGLGFLIPQTGHSAPTIEYEAAVRLTNVCFNGGPFKDEHWNGLTCDAYAKEDIRRLNWLEHHLRGLSAVVAHSMSERAAKGNYRFVLRAERVA